MEKPTLRCLAYTLDDGSEIFRVEALYRNRKGKLRQSMTSTYLRSDIDRIASELLAELSKKGVRDLLHLPIYAGITGWHIDVPLK